MDTVLLTGATGFLGSHIAEALVASGHRVRCSVRATSDTRWIESLDVDIVELDLSGAGDGIEATLALADTKTVIHCGGLTRARNEAEFMSVNAGGTDRLARAAAAAGVNRFVLISSLAARGPDGAAGPISPYGRSKAAAERHLATLRDDMSVVTIRPGGVYGPRDTDLLPLFDLASRGWIVVPRSDAPLQPVYVADVVSSVLAAMGGDAPDEPLPVAAESRHGWPAMARALSDAVGRKGRVIRLPASIFWTAGLLSEVGARLTGGLPPLDRRRAKDISVHAWTCDIEGTRRALPDWSPAVTIDEGLARTAAWYREIGWLK